MHPAQPAPESFPPRNPGALRHAIECLVADPQLPKIVTLDTMGADCATGAALARVVAARNGGACEFARESVPAHSIGICVIKLWV